MDRKYRAKLNLRNALGVLAIIGISFIDAPVLAQVGIRSRIESPTPLNIKPRTHIPSPADRYNDPRYNYPRYNPGYGHHHKHYPHHRRTHKRGGTVIIINPSRHNDYNFSDRNTQIRIIHP